MEYFIYHLRPFGIRNTLSGTAAPPPDRDLKATPWSGRRWRKKKKAEALEKQKEEQLKKEMEKEKGKEVEKD